MLVKTYIGKVKSVSFDYDIKGNWNGYSPDEICVCKETRKGTDCECEAWGTSPLYWDIVGEVVNKKPNTKQTDWGSFVMKMSKADLVEMLSRDKYKKVVNLLNLAKRLPDMEEYLLVALEIS